MRLRTWAAATSLFAMLSASILPAHAQSRVQSASQLVVVLDGSGSMWAKMPGSSRSKIDALRTELGQIVRTHLPRVALGLVSFGARSGNSCAASETLLQPAPGQLDRFDEYLGKFNPKGRGPVVLGLETAVQSVSGSKGPVRLLLIHDSPDNCRQDVCAFARDLAKKQPRIAVDVISLGLKRSQQGAMACLTKATGGRLIEAATMDAVLAGLGKSISAIPSATPAGLRKPPTTTRPTVVKKPVPKSTGVTARARLAGSKKAITGGIIWQIESKSPLKPSVSRTIRQPVLDVSLAPGNYRITMRTELVRLSKDVVVLPGARQPVMLEFDGGLVAVKVIGAKDRSTLVTVTRATTTDDAAGSAVWSGPASSARALLLKNGLYRISVGNGLNRISRTLDMAGGARHAIAFGSKTARLTVTSADLGKEQATAAEIRIAVDDAERPGKRRIIARSASTQATFELPAGPYHVTLRAFGAEKTTLMVLAAGETRSQTLTLPQMALRVTSHVGKNDKLAGSGIRYRLWRTNQLERPIAVSRKAQPVFHLVPGKYRIESRIGLQNAVMIRDFDVGPGASGNLELRHRAGRVDFSLPTEIGATLRQITFWELLDQESRTIWQSFAPSPSVTLAAGTYEVKMSSKGAHYSAKFAVVAGRIQAITPNKY